MSNEMTSHPDHGLLLRYADGDLGEAARQEIHTHLAACDICQEWLIELNSGVIEYQRNWWPDWKESAQPPPRPWFGLRERIDEMDEARAPVSAQRSWFDPRWAAVAAALIALVAIYRSYEQPVKAAELLREAASRETPASRAPIRITTRSGSVVRPAVWRQSRQALLTAGTAGSLRSRFEEANYSWDDPLSARSFSTWREKLPNPEDQVVKLRGQDGTQSYRITTRTATGTLAEASLRFRASDLHAVDGTLRFRDNEAIDITEVPGATLDIPVDPRPIAEAPTAAPRAPTGDVIVERVSPGEELQVWAALRRIDADLGEPIEVVRDPAANSVVVTALGLSAERRRALEGTLAGLPKVRLRFREPQPVREPARRLPESAGDASSLAPQIESQMGRGLAEDFVNRTLEASESCLMRVHALRELARHYPPEVEAQLSAQDRALLSSLLADHYTSFETASRRLLEHAHQIAPAGTPASQIPAQGWQAHAKSLVTTVEFVDQVLTKLLAASGRVGNPSSLTGDLSEGLRRLSTEMAAAGPVFRRAR